MKHFILTLCLLALASTSTPSFAKQPIVFDIGGVKLGEIVPDAVLESICPGSDFNGPGRYACVTTIEVNIVYHLRVTRLLYNHAIEAVFMNFDSSIYDTMVDTYTTKLGQQPDSTEQSKVQTGMGVTYTNIHSVWKTTDGLFVISKYGNNISKGNAWISTPAYAKYQEEAKAVTQKGLGDQL